MKPNGLVALLALIAVFSCKKKESNVAACDKDNFGVVTVTFASATENRSIISTLQGALTFREKILPPGKFSDTMHLTTGEYTLSLARLNSSGASLQDESRKQTVLKCGSHPINISF